MSPEIEATVDEEALAPRRVARRVHQLDRDVADGDVIARLVGDELALGDAGRPGDPRRLGSLHVDRHVDPLEQPGQPLDRQPHHRAADVVGVVVRGEHAADDHAVGLDGVDDVVDGVRRVDEQALARLPVADGVDEVDHLRGHGIADGEVAAGQELAEVQALGRSHPVTLRWRS